MRLVQSKGVLKKHLGLTFVFLTVLILLIGSLAPFYLGAVAAEAEKENEVPEWSEGDYWKYKSVLRAPQADIKTIIEKEVKDRDVEINYEGDQGDTKSYDVYQVKRTEYSVGNPENKTNADVYIWHKELAQISNNPENQPTSGYHPPIIELDFPLHVGKNWSTDAGFDNHHDLAKYYADLKDPDEGDLSEHSREYAFLGKVENKTTKEVELNKGVKEFETFKVNTTLLTYDKEKNTTQLNRYELYYSPEVKNVVYTEIYSAKKLPEDYSMGEDTIKETRIGNETLLAFETSPYTPDDNGDGTSLLGVGIVILILGVGTASIWVYKKVKSSL